MKVIHSKVLANTNVSDRVETQSQIQLDGVQQSFNANYAMRNLPQQNEGGVNDFCVIVSTKLKDDESI